ncbi:hypothetical protein ACNJYZ_19700, partial [Stenotrophomonas maltophilia]
AGLFSKNDRGHVYDKFRDRVMFPIFYMVNAFRYGLLGSSDVPLPVAYGLMIGFVVVLTALALWLLRRGVGMRS